MVEPIKENDTKEDAQANAQIEKQPVANVADLHLPQIIAALHQNAIAKCAGDLGSDFRISNSALDGEGNKISLTSAGQHIISVIPVKADVVVPKKDAVKALKTYVSWFVGPDLANKINDSTVKSLNEAPGNEEKKEEKNESIKPFMKFSQFLREAEEDTEEDETSGFGDDEQEETEPEKESSEFGDKEESSEESAENKNDNKEAKTEDESVESKLGYYVPYDLKVEGLKQTALKDAMKKFAMNFFDDLKITASGLFGGGDSFTTKDVKTKLRDVFGPIDPDKLVQNVRDRIEKKYKSDDQPDVKIQQKDTLISDLGSYINGKQAQKISSADYSLYIRVDQDDPKNEIFTPRIIADIVQSSITGLYKKFKNKVTAADVIYIPNYRDIHNDTKKLRTLYNSVVVPDDIRIAIKKAKHAAEAYIKIEHLIDKFGKNPNRNQCSRAEECHKVWKKFKEIWDKRGDNAKTREALSGNNKEKYFEQFEKEYTKAYNDNEDASLEESIQPVFVIANSEISKLIFESMFGNASTTILDEKEKEEDKNKNIAKRIKDFIAQQIKGLEYDPGNMPHVVCDKKDKVLSKLQEFNVQPELADNDYKNAVAIIPNTKSLAESAISDDIMSILFEADDTTDDSNKKNVSKKNIEEIFRAALKDSNIKDIGSCVDVYPKKNDSTKMPRGYERAYIMFFGKNAIDKSSGDDNDDFNGSKDDISSFSSTDGKIQHSLFIIPMPGLKYEDSEYANTNI